MSKFYSEYGEDRWIAENVVLPEKSFYLDLGCAWPFLNSNTAFLRDRGWDGANIDGNASYEPNWSGVGTFTNCVIGDGRVARFITEGVPELSRIAPAPALPSEIVKTRRLDELLEYSPRVDFISVDLEGGEYDALQTFDWEKNRPVCIVAEYATWHPDGVVEDFRVKEMLEAMGYRERYRTKANLIFTL